MLVRCALIIILVVSVWLPAQALEKRCGWYSNPTPANEFLDDKDGEWLISKQGGEQSEWARPQFSSKQWVYTGPSYGYGCLCLQAKADHASKTIIKIYSARALPLETCQQDKALTNPCKNVVLDDSPLGDGSKALVCEDN